MRDFLTAQEVSILEEAHRAAQQKKEADRIKTILLLNEGFSYKTIAHILRLDDTTVRRYYKGFKTEGIDGLLEDHYHGSLSSLTRTQETELTAYLKTNLHQTAKVVSLYIQKTYGVTYSIEGTTHLLHRLGFVYKKTKIVPGKVNFGRQRVFKQLYELLKDMKETEDRIYFLDGTHPVHNNRPCYGWIYKLKVYSLITLEKQFVPYF